MVSFVLGLVAALVVSTGGWAAPAAADPVVICPLGASGQCITVDLELSPPPPTGSGSCKLLGIPVACLDSLYGWFNSVDQCYWKAATPQPPAGDPKWGGRAPTDGLLYTVNCLNLLGLVIGNTTVFRVSPPPGYGGNTSAEALALALVVDLPLLGPEMRIAPPPGTAGLVGLPVWLWTPSTLLTWGPVRIGLNIPGLSVYAEALGAKVVWDMGDGHTVTCTTVGTPFTIDKAGKPSPTCGYLYPKPSTNEPGGVFNITATTTWHVQIVGLGARLTVDVVRGSGPISLRVQELQVLAG